MAHLLALKLASDLHAIADLLGYKPASLAYLLYAMPPHIKYKKFEIDKRSGGKRLITAPCSQLKLLQSRLANVLQNCLDEIESTTASRVRNASHGFKRGRSIVTNAKHHRNRRYVFNVDLAEFFPTLNFGRVRGYFINDKSFALGHKVATILAQIACFEGALPQGSPCSPVISNLIAHILDVHLTRLARLHGCTYTRYADDLTFSTNKREFPTDIAYRNSAEPNKWYVGTALGDCIMRSGFVLNEAKTRMQYRDSRQEVTGLVVNKKINVRKEYRHTVRAMVHRLFTTGTFEIPTAAGKKKGQLAQLHGMLGFIDFVERRSRTIPTKETMYRRFLIYKDFFASDRPVLVCEGKTDNVYITHAIRRLAATFPSLAAIGKGGEVNILVRRYRYANTGTGRILGLGGGFGDLKSFIGGYHREVRRFKAGGSKHPVILIVDNDDAAKQIFPVVQTAAKMTTKPVGTEEFIHIAANLYLVVVPPVNRVFSTVIEDLFDAHALAMTYKGKHFSSADIYNPNTHFGKSEFAENIVRPNADMIDFSGFSPLLDRITKVILDYSAKSL